MKVVSILFVVLVCINCRNPEVSSTGSFDGFTYGFTIGGGLTSSSSTATIDLRNGVNDTAYIFHFKGNSSSGNQKLVMTQNEVETFARAVNNTIEDQMQNPRKFSGNVYDGTKIFVYRACDQITVKAEVQIINDIKTDLPRIDSLITLLHGKGASL